MIHLKYTAADDIVKHVLMNYDRPRALIKAMQGSDLSFSIVSSNV